MTGYLARVRAVYSGCRAYRDRGDVAFVYDGARRTASFGTRYIRPNRFRFDAEDSVLGRLVISSDEFGARSWTSGDAQVVESSDIATALLELPERVPALWLSPSFQALSVIPPLLLPSDQPPSRLGIVHDWRVGGESVLEGRDCVDIKGTQRIDPSPGLEQMAKWFADWIGPSEKESLRGRLAPLAAAKVESVSLTVDLSDYLIRRFAANDVVLTYWPEVDAEISEAEFSI